MSDLFYLIFLFATFFAEYPTIFAPLESTERQKRIKDLVKKNEENKKIGKVRERMLSKDVLSIFISLTYIFVCVIGLLSSQWLGFLLIIFLGFVLYPLRKLLYYKSLQAMLTSIQGIVSFIISILIVLNKYHFHYSMDEILRRLLN